VQFYGLNQRQMAAVLAKIALVKASILRNILAFAEIELAVTIAKSLVPRKGLEPPRSYPLVPESFADCSRTNGFCCFLFRKEII
jgi:hypothetical protein